MSKLEILEEKRAQWLKIVAWAKERRRQEREAELKKVVELPRKKVDSLISPSLMPKLSVVVPFRKPSNRSE